MLAIEKISLLPFDDKSLLLRIHVQSLENFGGNSRKALLVYKPKMNEQEVALDFLIDSDHKYYSEKIFGILFILYSNKVFGEELWADIKTRLKKVVFKNFVTDAVEISLYTAEVLTEKTAASLRPSQENENLSVNLNPNRWFAHKSLGVDESSKNSNNQTLELS